MAKKPQKNNFKTLAGLIFFLVAVAHLTIIVTGSHLSINNIMLESWVNWLAFIVTGYMGLVAFDVV